MINIIAAIGKNNELGKNGELIWSIPKDMKYFREKTKGAVIFMGRNTFNSLPKVLPGRKHIVLSTKNEFNKEIDGQVDVIDNKEEFIQLAKINGENEDVFVIGGASIYEMFMDVADKLYITHINKSDKQADVFFPEIDSKVWRRLVISSEEDNNIRFSFAEYFRK